LVWSDAPGVLGEAVKVLVNDLTLVVEIGSGNDTILYFGNHRLNPAGAGELEYLLALCFSYQNIFHCSFA
jgi:hypothetical protein